MLSLVCASLLTVISPSAALTPPATLQVTSNLVGVALSMADGLLRIQNADGAIPDAPDSDLVNEDSNMEYALIGLAAAYRQTRDTKYLRGFEKGIDWLAARQEMTDPMWKGSWYYHYSFYPPYAPVPAGIDNDVIDVRGVDATSSLFAYLVGLHARLTGTRTMADKYAANVQAALNFVLNRNRAADGSFMSSWHQHRDRSWTIYDYNYTADQADVYLGLQMGSQMYGTSAYSHTASQLKSLVGSFFVASLGRYAVGRTVGSPLDTDLDGFNGVFAQGYVPWVFGSSFANVISSRWLTSRVRFDGGFGWQPTGFREILGTSLVLLAGQTVRGPLPPRSPGWIVMFGYDPKDGLVRDTNDPTSPKYSNVTGFTIASLLRFPAFP